MIFSLPIKIIAALCYVISLPFALAEEFIHSSSNEEVIPIEFQEEKKEQSSARFYPLSLKTNAFKIKPASSSNIKNHHIGYQQYNATLTYTHPVSSNLGSIASLGWLRGRLMWSENSFFKENNDFDYLLLSMGGYTQWLSKWHWSLIFSALLDPKEAFDISYGIFQAVLWGKYHVSSKLELNLGIINEVGLHKEKTWPILGLMFKPNSNLILNLIYPLNFSFDYFLTKFCSFGSAYKIIRFRKKIEKKFLPNTLAEIFEYENKAIELNLKVNPTNAFSIKGALGWALGQDLSLADKKNKLLSNYKLNSSPFFEANLLLSF